MGDTKSPILFITYDPHRISLCILHEIEGMYYTDNIQEFPLESRGIAFRVNKTLLDVPMKIGPDDDDDDDDDDNDFLEDEEVDNMTLGGDCHLVNFQLEEHCEEDEGEECQFLGFLLQYWVCPGHSLLQNLQENQ